MTGDVPGRQLGWKFFNARVDGRQKNAAELTARQLGPSTRVIETGHTKEITYGTK